MMEADHLRKKYKTIRNELIDEKVGFESTLLKLEGKIGSQENEISRLQVSGIWLIVFFFKNFKFVK